MSENVFLRRSTTLHLDSPNKFKDIEEKRGTLEEDPIAKKERNKVIDTEDASRGPLSGCIRLADSSRVIQRLKVREALQFRYKYLQIYRPTYLHLEFESLSSEYIQPALSCPSVCQGTINVRGDLGKSRPLPIAF